jgi:amino acid adenylation domain-containing protein
MVVGVLAILKAGAGYVPLDPAYPAERLAYMLADSAPALLLTEAALQARLPAPALPRVRIDADWPAIALRDDANPDPAALGLEPRHLAYVIYTSGSTGMPKGVMVEHANLSRLFAATHPRFGFDASDVWTLFHSIAFDFSVWELWGALAYGGRLVLVSALCARAPQDFYALLCDEGVTVLNQTPSAFRQLIAAQAETTRPHVLRHVIFGGEALDLRTLQPWAARNDPSRTRLINMYGITEITVHATLRQIGQADIDAALGSLIGKPIADLRSYLLDARGQPVPIGVIGELYIGGAGVARGYLNRPELTAERFLADPFSPLPQARMYKSGDLGRYLPDGSLEYLGRNDFQVKIRGFRIELGEIEARLAACAGVRDAIVIARQDAPGEQRLVAYVIAHDGAELDAGALRAELAATLADYMLPSAFVRMPRFPLNASGKLDRHALPAPDQGDVAARAFAAPVGPLETALAAIWQELLGLAQVGRDDHFFELGGHSLMVITLIERLRQQGISADVRTVFGAPVLHAMAASMAGERQSPALPVPPNLIPSDCRAIDPGMLPLVTLSQAEIDRIVRAVPQGAANIQDIYRLAPLQEGILFHHLLESEGDAYLMRSIFMFDSRARLDRFLAALQSVIDRHDILRSSMHWEGLSEPVQVVQRHAPLPIHTLTLDAEGSALEQLRTHTDPRRLRLDLRRAPLLAAFVAHDGASDEWMLALLDHHMVSDNTTLALIIAEIQQLLSGGEDQLPPALPYRNFIAQARAVSVAEHEAYFRRQLGDIDTPTAPFGLLNVQDNGSATEEARLTLERPLASAVRDAARQHGVTAAVLFHAAWAQVLAQCCGRDDVVFGTVLSGRLQGSDGAGQVLGMFINTLPIRISLGALGVGQVVRETYQRLGELLSHEQASLALAQRCSGVAAPMPLFTSILNYRHNKVAAAAQDDTADKLAWEGMRGIVAVERTNYPVSVSVDDLGTGFSLTAQCASGIDPARIVAYLQHAIGELVHALMRRPGQAVNALSILPPAEQQQLLLGFNDARCAAPSEQLIHHLFEAQCAARPDAIALIHGDRQMTYLQLNQRANQVAHQLLALGVSADRRVAICADRSAEMIIAMLAVLKAGGAYVPLDPAYPAERLAFMLDDSAPVAILAQAQYQSRLPAATLPLVLLDAPCPMLDAQPDGNPDRSAQGLNSASLAYVIYTSGSTGTPKGVMVEHRNVVHLVRDNPYVRVTPDACIAHCANPAFDASTWEIWAGLLHGARLLVIDQATLLDPVACSSLCESANVTILHLTAGLFNQYAALFAPLIARLDYLMFGGEQADFRAVARVFQDCAPRHMVHCYGPTETTTFATTHEIRDIAPGAYRLPIGRPIANTQVYILDANRQPVPLGVEGELYIGGNGVARGYLNQAELTAERFVTVGFDTAGFDTAGFDTVGATRMYKTGDLGRYLPDGNIEYLGRNDFQFKIRGFRIEPAEIEARLAACTGVREALVIAREAGPGDKRLVAYLVAEPGAAPSAAALRAELATVLADYMLPSAFVTLDSFPLTPNGKVDRRALPAPDQAAGAASAYRAPAGPTETALATLWQEMLGLPRVGRDDNFFALGGHSLMVITLIEQLRRQGMHTDVRTLFTAPTLAELATRIEQRQQDPAHDFVVPPNLIPNQAEPTLTEESVEEFRV